MRCLHCHVLRWMGRVQIAIGCVIVAGVLAGVEAGLVIAAFFYGIDSIAVGASNYRKGNQHDGLLHGRGPGDES